LKGGNVTPIALEIVRPIAAEIIDSKKLPRSGDWPSLTDEDIAKVLELFSSKKSTEGEPVYVCGGKLHRLDDEGKLTATEHSAAEPYLWPIAHDVRPAAQSLGVRRCEDCHLINESFFFGEVEVDSPLISERDCVKKMVEFQNLNPVYTKLFAMSFVFRPLLKVVALGSCAVLGMVLLLYGLKALACIARVLIGED
jgi:hypothetical protein